MPKSFRKCSLCPVNSYANPESVIFTATCGAENRFICELHFKEEDIRTHGPSKRLKTGAQPLWADNPTENSTVEEETFFDCSEDTTSQENSQPNFSSQTSVPLTQSSQSTYNSSQSSWHPSNSQTSTESDILDDLENDDSRGMDLAGAAILVMWSCLLPLLSKCTHQGCGAAVNPDNMVTHRNGASLKISLRCDDGHCEEWSSSESIKAGRWTVPLINLGIICYSFVCGLHWEQLQAFFSKLGVLSVSTATFYRYLDKVVYPFVWANWRQNQADNLEEVLKTQEETDTGCSLAGDGRFDSPGWCAKFCSYVLEDLRTKKIIGFMVACKHQVKSSSAMEVFALKSLLLFLKNSKVKIRVLVTDRSTSVRSMMEEDFPEIKHEFDPWHVIKNIKANVYKASKLKSCRILKDWLSSIVNMLWWSLSTANGSAELARQKVLSILHHTSGSHSFPTFNLFPKCAHGTIEQNKPWIPEGSLAHSKLRKAICGKKDKNLSDLAFLTECCQTSDIESFNNLVLKYANKTFSYSWLGMIMRTCLACLDWNSNVGRGQKLSQTGVPVYRIKVDRSGKKSVVPVKVKKCYKWQDTIFQNCVDGLKTGNIPQHQYPVVNEDSLKEHQEEFSKEEAIARLETRMRMF